MMQATAAARKETNEKPKAYTFSLKTPYMKQGRVTQLVAETENVWIHTKINAEGGENEIHTHLNEDHSFIVLEGQMSVFDETGREMKVEKYQGVMIPKGAYYRYLNTGAGIWSCFGLARVSKASRKAWKCASVPMVGRCSPDRLRTRRYLPS